MLQLVLFGHFNFWMQVKTTPNLTNMTFLHAQATCRPTCTGHVHTNMALSSCAGHVHTYFRSCPVEKGQCSKDGITHFVAGTGGHELTDMSDGASDAWVADAHKYVRSVE